MAQSYGLFKKSKETLFCLLSVISVNLHPERGKERIEGDGCPLFYWKMIRKKEILELLKDGKNLPDFFIVELKTTSKNTIRLYIDNHRGITINECSEVSRYLSYALDTKGFVFDLEVSSPGLDMPLRVPEQYDKYRGKKVEVILTNGVQKKGVLEQVLNEGFLLKEEKKVKVAGKKKKEVEIITEQIGFNDIKTTKLIISFN